ncbi:MAG: hypothetical protein E6416_04570 [Enterococcus faecalis]|nr:hypothetical protein [Enterococcus faecalis]
MYRKGLMKKGDIIVIIFLIAISFSPYFIFFHNKPFNSKSFDDTKYAVVKIDGKEIERINLGISEPGQTSICIPHRFILEIVQQYSKDYYIY